MSDALRSSIVNYIVKIRPAFIYNCLLPGLVVSAGALPSRSQLGRDHETADLAKFHQEVMCDIMPSISNSFHRPAL